MYKFIASSEDSYLTFIVEENYLTSDKKENKTNVGIMKNQLEWVDNK